MVALIGSVYAGSVWYAQSRLTTINDAYAAYLAREAKGAASARQLNRLIFEANYWVYRTIAETETEQVQRGSAGLNGTLTQIEALLPELRRQAPTFMGQIDALEERLKQYANDLADVRSFAIENKKELAMALVHDTIDPTFNDMVQAGAKLGNDILIHANELSHDLTRRTNETRRNLMGVSASGLVIGILLAALIAVMGITRPMGRLVGALKRMAAGDASAEIAGAERQDEVGQVGRAVVGIRRMVAEKAAEQAEAKRAAEAEAMIERQGVMRQIADRFERAVGGVVETVSSSAIALQSTAEVMTTAASETASQSTAVAAAAEQAGVNVSTAASAVHELGASIQEIGRQVASSASLAKAAVTEADQTNLLVQELSKTAAKIGEVVTMISGIADQTNLLALNATIEAARAGEVGRGFSVVAAEVKTLADQTRRATDEIAGQVSRIQDSTGHAVSAIDGIARRIRDMSEATSAITAAVTQQGAATDEFVRNVAQAAQGTREVTNNIAGVAGTAEETGAAAAQVLVSASELSEQSEHLKREVAQFLQSVSAG
ncbi:MAG: methyl-accepting chemotaxis protein [Aestuariivirga sp.]